MVELNGVPGILIKSSHDVSHVALNIEVVSECSPVVKPGWILHRDFGIG